MAKVEQYIKDYTRNGSNELVAIEDRYGSKVISYHEWLTPDNARAAAKIAKGEMIEKACEYMRNHIDEQLTLYHERTWKKRDKFIEDFRKAMEE